MKSPSALTLPGLFCLTLWLPAQEASEALVVDVVDPGGPDAEHLDKDRLPPRTLMKDLEEGRL